MGDLVEVVVVKMADREKVRLAFAAMSTVGPGAVSGLESTATHRSLPDRGAHLQCHPSPAALTPMT
jgi:hypothetical protein